MTVYGTVDNSGEINVGGEMEVNSYWDDATSTYVGGHLDNTGTITLGEGLYAAGDLTNTGSLSVRDQIEVDGDIVLGDSSVINVGFNISAENWGYLNAGDDLELGGTLNVDAAGFFGSEAFPDIIVNQGNQFEVFNNDDSSGYFRTVTGLDAGADAGFVFDLDDNTLVAREVTDAGGDGNDTLTGDATDGNAMVGGGGNDELIGGDGDDVLFGQADNDLLVGGDGDDHLFGGAGDNVFDGGDGDDTLFGDGGSDTYVIRAGEFSIFSRDSIVDFGAEDTILFEGFTAFVRWSHFVGQFGGAVKVYSDY